MVKAFISPALLEQILSTRSQCSSFSSQLMNRTRRSPWYATASVSKNRAICQVQAFEDKGRSFSRMYGTHASKARQVKILGIESSCDDSCAAVMQGEALENLNQSNLPEIPSLLSSVVLGQDHFATGGIHPLNASISHGANVPRAIQMALEQAQATINDIDAIAVTRGPGMMQSLSAGMVAAKTIASLHAKPIIYIHHMVAHALTPLFTEEPSNRPHFPFLTLLVSGGHTMLVLAQGFDRYTILSTTTDDSIGDAFDKAARALNISWGSGTGFSNPGAALEQFASQADPAIVEALRGEKRAQLPVAMRGRMDFSYSGLKTMVERAAEHVGQDESNRKALAWLFQEAAIAQLEDKLSLLLSTKKRSAKGLPDPPNLQPEEIGHLVCSGGVASNAFLRDRLRACLERIGRSDIKTLSPLIKFCTDNAAMIAHAGLLFYSQRSTDLTVQPTARWSMEQL